MNIFALLKELASGKAPGPPPSFRELHLLKAIDAIGERGVIGRKALSNELKLGEGVTRTIIARLENANLISVSRAGCKLTEKGKMLYHELRAKLVRKLPVEPSSITVGAYNFGIMVKDAAHNIRRGIEQRDAAVRAGADGATILVYKGKKLTIPSISEDALKDYPDAAKRIIKLFQPEENDVIILGGASTQEKAEDGAMEAAWMLLQA